MKSKFILGAAAREDSRSSRRRVGLEPLEERRLLAAQSLGLETAGYAEIADAAALDLSNASAFTIEAWVRRNASNANQALLSKDFLSGYYLGLEGGRLRFYSGGSAAVNGTTVLPVNLWTHVAVTWSSGGLLSFYINGERELQTTATARPSGNSFPLYLGADPGPSSSLFGLTGRLSEVRIWQEVRTLNELAQNMHAKIDPQEGLIAAWSLDGDAQETTGRFPGQLRGDARFRDVPAPAEPVRAAYERDFNTLTADRTGAAIVNTQGLNGRALLIGGLRNGAASSRIEYFDFESGRLANGPNALSAALVGPAGALAENVGRVYTFGGADAAGVLSRRIHRIDPLTGQSELLTVALPQPMHRSAAVYHPPSGLIFLIGGELSNGATSNEILAFDPVSEQFNTFASLTLTEGRENPVAIFSNATQEILIFGGSTSVAARQRVDALTFLVDGRPPTLNAISEWSLPRPATSLRAVEDPVTKLIYAVGGSQRRVLAIDPRTRDRWETQLELSGALEGIAFTYDVKTRRALVIGGMDFNDAAAYRRVSRLPLGDGPALATGIWEFESSVSSAVTSLDGDDAIVAVGTAANGAYRYNAGGGRSQSSPSELNSDSGRVNDVFYEAWMGETYWIGTDDAGFARDFAGDVSTVASAAQLGTNRVWAVNAAPDGVPLVGTSAGLRAFGIHPQTGAPMWHQAFNGSVATAAEHRFPVDAWALVNGQLAAAPHVTIGFGTTQTYGAPCGLISADDMAFGKHLDWWIAATGDSEFGGGGVCHLPLANPPNTNRPAINTTQGIGDQATAIDVDTDGRAWVSYSADFHEGGGLAVYESDGSAAITRATEWTWLNAPIGSRTANFNGTSWQSDLQAVAAVDERIWLGDDDGRIMTFAPRWKNFDDGSPLAAHAVRRVWLAGGRAFFGADDLVVLEPDGVTWREYPDVRVHDLATDSQGRIWLTTDSGPLIYLGDEFLDLTSLGGDRPIDVKAVATDRAGRVWLGATNGVTLFDRERFVTRLHFDNSGLPDNRVTALFVDSNQRLWAGTEAGLGRWNGTEFDRFGVAQGLTGHRIADIVQLPNGDLAVSTLDAGLFIHRGGVFTATSTPSTQMAESLAVDSLGQLWYRNYVLTPAGWRVHLDTNSGISRAQTSGLAADPAGNVWLSHGAFGASVRTEYLPPPSDVLATISGISPDTGGSGDTVTITGTGFGRNTSDIAVNVGDAEVTILSITDNEIRVRINDSVSSGDVVIHRGGRRTVLSNAFRAIPRIDSFTPSGGSNGVEIVISGANFDRGAEVLLGNNVVHPGRFLSPTLLSVVITPDAISGTLRVRNRVAGSEVTHTATASTSFQYVGVSINEISLNQGLRDAAFMQGKPTLVQSFLQHSVAPRAADAVEVDTAEITFQPEGGVPVTYSVPTCPSAGSGILACALTAPTRTGAPTEADRRDIANSFNFPVIPRIDLPTGSGPVTTDVTITLRRRGQLVAQHVEQIGVRRNKELRVLMVPIMPNGYTEDEVAEMQRQVDAGLEDLRRRIFPTGDVVMAWSPISYSVNDVLIGDASTIAIGNGLELYDASHNLDRARRHWNEHNSYKMNVALGVVHSSVVEPGDSGLAFWTDVTELMNELVLNYVDALCDVGDEVLSWFGLSDGSGCELDIPARVAWASHDGGNLATDPTVGPPSQPSALFGHELGHVMGLVKPWASNAIDRRSDLDDFNISHSFRDELFGGYCGEKGAAFSEYRTFYYPSNVREPVVNPLGVANLSDQQLRPDFTGDEPQRNNHAKAIMAYGCGKTNDNVFFEPSDRVSIFDEMNVTALEGFINLLVPGEPSSPQPDDAFLQSLGGSADGGAGGGVPDGARLFVTGTVARDGSAGELRRVERLGAGAALDLEFASGYEIVQLGVGGAELSRHGVFGSFHTSDTHNADIGFFASTVLLHEDAARIELRYQGTVLDVFAPGPSAPTVTVANPTGGVFQTTVPLNWTAADTDGDHLEFVLEFSSDNGATWSTVGFASGATRSMNVPVNRLTATTSGRFRVVSTDGLRESAAMTAVVSIAGARPQAYIGNPTNGATSLEGRTMQLVGDAALGLSASLTESNFRWSSDRDGFLGAGRVLNTALGAGVHQITLEVRSLSGLVDIAHTEVTILGDYDRDGVPDSVETQFGLNTLDSRDAFLDQDGDGLNWIVEFNRGLNPQLADTDGDGRSDAEELVAGTNPARHDAPLLPNELFVSPAELNFSADLSRDVPLPQLQLFVSAQESTEVTLSANVPWLKANIATARTTAAFTISVNVAMLPDGQHFGVVSINSVSLPTINVPVSVLVQNRVAHFDVNGDGVANESDAELIEASLGLDNSDPSFDYRLDLDRDGDIDQDDLGLAGQALDSAAPTVDILNVTPDPRRQPVAAISIRFSEAVIGFDLGDLRLTRDDASVPLAPQQTLVSDDGVNWSLGNLGTLTARGGAYRLTVVAAGSGITDLAGNPLETDASDAWANISLEGDTNYDGVVNLTDLNNVRNNFGGQGLGDTNGDGIVNLSDLNAVRNNFGAGASPVVPQGVALHISRLERAMRSLPSLRYSQLLRSAATDVLFSTLDEPLVPNPRRPAQRRLTGR